MSSKRALPTDALVRQPFRSFTRQAGDHRVPVRQCLDVTLRGHFRCTQRGNHFCVFAILFEQLGGCLRSRAHSVLDCARAIAAVVDCPSTNGTI